MKKVILTIFQFVLFLIVFGAGSLFPPFHFERVLIVTPGFTRIFVADGLLLMFALYILIVLVEVMRKRLRTSAPWTTVAVIFAVVLGLMMKFGFLTRSAF
jgi:type IV secretory pathway VirB2 component (pilin)